MKLVAANKEKGLPSVDTISTAFRCKGTAEKRYFGFNGYFQEEEAEWEGRDPIDVFI